MDKLIWAVVPLVPAVLLDFILGDPQWLYHPVRIIGAAIDFFKGFLRKVFPKSKKGELLGGTILALAVPLLSFTAVWVILYFLSKVNLGLAMVLDTFLCYQMLAAKSLKIESNRVKNALLNKDIPAARKWLSYIVGRDTEDLREEEIIRATVETVSENTSDGVIAPMVYIGILGAPLCYFYKGVNTLDSMVGYQNEEYRYFGRASAKLDDVLNFLPARFSGLLIIVAAFFCKLNYKNAFKIFLRDRNNHPSPNSAQTEAACAGALEVQLGGGGYYGGVYKEKQTIGDPIKKIEVNDIDRANKLMFVSAIVGSVVIAVVRAVVIAVVVR